MCMMFHMFCYLHITLNFCSIYNAEHSKSMPSGHEAIFVTVGGRSADLSGGGRYPIYLTVKKGLTHGYNMSTAISSIAVTTGRVK